MRYQESDNSKATVHKVKTAHMSENALLIDGSEL